MGASFDDALANLYWAHAKALVEMSWVYVGDRADAEDVCLDAFVRLRRAWNGIDPSDDPTDTIGRFLQTAAFEIVRSAFRTTLITWRYKPAVEPYDPADEDLGLRDDQTALLTAIRRLPVRPRNAIVLRYWQDLPDAEIAAVLGVPVTSVATHLQRAMSDLDAPNVDASLRELAGAIHARLHPSADLLGRIETATVGRDREKFPTVRFANAAAAAVVILALAVPLLAGDVSHQPMTRMQFIVQVDHACDASGVAFARDPPVFPTPDGNKAVATALLAATQRLLSAAYADNPPPDARAVLSNVDTELQSALATLQNVLSDVDAGDLTKARVALKRFRDLIRVAASDLAAYGAHHCVLTP